MTRSGPEKVRRVIRENMFETNSSSSHSFTLGEGEFVADRAIPIKKGVAVIYPGEFGWGPETHRDAPTKAAYCLIHAMREKLSGQGEGCLRILHMVLEKELGCVVEFRPNDSWRGETDWGQIDHQSQGMIAEVFEDPAALHRFIFDKGSELVISNDNM